MQRPHFVCLQPLTFLLSSLTSLNFFVSLKGLFKDVSFIKERVYGERIFHSSLWFFCFVFSTHCSFLGFYRSNYPFAAGQQSRAPAGVFFSFFFFPFFPPCLGF